MNGALAEEVMHAKVSGGRFVIFTELKEALLRLG